MILRFTCNTSFLGQILFSVDTRSFGSSCGGSKKLHDLKEKCRREPTVSGAPSWLGGRWSTPLDMERLWLRWLSFVSCLDSLLFWCYWLRLLLLIQASPKTYVTCDLRHWIWNSCDFDDWWTLCRSVDNSDKTDWRWFISFQEESTIGRANMSNWTPLNISNVFQPPEEITVKPCLHETTKTTTKSTTTTTTTNV